LEFGWDCIEIERFAYERAEQDHQFTRMDRMPGDHLAHGALCQPDMPFGAKQDAVGRRCLDRIADAPCAV
jgi:hypothetical protein